MTQYNLRFPPPTNHFSHKNHSTLLIFDTPQNATTFRETIPPTIFGPQSTYTPAPRPNPKPNTPKPTTTRHPLLHVVVRGVATDIGDKEFLEAICPPDSCRCGRRLVRAQRIVGRDGQVTGLVRLFMSCQSCCEAFLKDGLLVHGRPYRVEAPRTILIRPCGRCHDYGHESPTCTSRQSRCRVCGMSVAGGTKCDHEGHDLSKPYCATCNRFGHYTGQRQCPRYPSDPRDPLSSPPVKIITPAPAPTSNPWNLKLQDFPSLKPETLLPPPAHPAPPTDPDHSSPPADPKSNAPDTNVPPTRPDPTNHTPSDAPQPNTDEYVTHDVLNAFLDQLLTVLSEGFKRTFDALLTLLLTSAPAQGQQRVRDAVNSVTKRMFDSRTILQAVGSGLNVIHTNAKRPNHGR